MTFKETIMNKEIEKLARQYKKFLRKPKPVKLPAMPKTNSFSYTDNEYLNCVNEMSANLDFLDEVYITENFLKGDKN